MMLAQVPLARFMRVPQRNFVYRMAAARRHAERRLAASATPASQVVAVVDVRPVAATSDRSRKRHERMERVLQAAEHPGATCGAKARCRRVAQVARRDCALRQRRRPPQRPRRRTPAAASPPSRRSRCPVGRHRPTSRWPTATAPRLRSVGRRVDRSRRRRGFADDSEPGGLRVRRSGPRSAGRARLRCVSPAGPARTRAR